MGFLRTESSDNPYIDYDSITPAWLVENAVFLLRMQLLRMALRRRRKVGVSTGLFKIAVIRMNLPSLVLWAGTY
jgi:hypothetical protein